MVLFITGLVSLALGLFSGAVLVLGPLGVATWEPGMALWIFFPLLCMVGYSLCVVGARADQLRGLSMLVATLLILLALACAAGLVLMSAGMVTPRGSSWSLWYVLAVAGVLGIVGAASASRSQSGDRPA
jgi:hypothetical protein